MGAGKFEEISAQNENSFECVLKNKLFLTGQLLNVWRLKRQGKFTVQNSVKFYIYSEDKATLEGRDVQDVFVLCVQEPNMHGLYSVIIHAPVSPTHEMITAFEDFVEWDRNPLFPAAPGPFTDKFLRSICLKRGGMPPKEHPCEAYALDGDKAMEGPREHNYKDNGDRIRLAGLTLKDVNQVMATELTRVWMHAKIKQQMELSITNLATAGVFVNDDLAAFAMLSPAGLMNNVWTEEPFRRRGLAVKVLQTLSHFVAAMGCTPMAECTVTNNTSRQLLKKLGFTFVQETNWVTFKKA